MNLSEKNGRFFEEELEKLDRWGEDQRNSLKTRLKELEDQIKEAKRSSRLAANLPEKLALEREKRNLDTKRDEAWKEYEEAAKAIESKKDSLIDEVERRLNQQVEFKPLFNLRWRLTNET